MPRLSRNYGHFASAALDGFGMLFPGYVRRLEGGVVRARKGQANNVRLVTGGGSGHFPGVAGLVGPGLADAAALGEVFAAPAVSRILNVCDELETGSGIIFCYGNYSGDCMSFRQAGEILKSKGIEVEHVVVTDDVASAPVSAQRRGIAGELYVLKILGAACEAGLPLKEAAAAGRHANAQIRSLGFAFEGGSLPGGSHPPYVVPAGHIGWGVGVHGEPYLEEIPLGDLDDLSEQILLSLDLNARVGSEISMLINGLGGMPTEELLHFGGVLAKALLKKGYSLTSPIVGEYFTSLDCRGFSVSLFSLDPALKAYLLAPCDCPGLSITQAFGSGEIHAPDAISGRSASEYRRTSFSKNIKYMLGAFWAIRSAMAREAATLAELDAICGDGDHGEAMLGGASAALRAMYGAASNGFGTLESTRAAAHGWSEASGGASGFLWSSAIDAFAIATDGLPLNESRVIAKGFKAAAVAVSKGGDCRVGQKTIYDALAPFADALSIGAESGLDISQAWLQALQAARLGCMKTREMIPQKGRSRFFGHRMIGIDDAGSYSFLVAMEAIFRFGQPCLSEQTYVSYRPKIGH